MMEKTTVPSAPVPEAGARPVLRQRTKCFLIFAAGLCLCFATVLLGLFRFSINSELYSHILLVPAISGYLVWTDRHRLSPVFEPAKCLAVLLLLPGLALLAAYWLGLASGWSPASENDRLSLLTPAFLFCFASGFAWFFGGRILRATAFPLAFLIFMVPFPLALENGLVEFLQHGSAESSYLMLTGSGMSVFREGTDFTLPGVTIGVAPECSGVRSSLVLFITGLLAAYFFLRRPWSRITLAVLLIPLGILRNAFRIFTLAQLAVHYDPNILDSPLHHRGGPVFFAVSLAPFFLLIWLLRKWETRLEKQKAGKETIPGTNVPS